MCHDFDSMVTPGFAECPIMVSDGDSGPVDLRANIAHALSRAKRLNLEILAS